MTSTCSVASAIDCFDTPVIVERRREGSYVNGRFVEDGSPRRFRLLASVQPARADELQRLPEGRRTSAAIKLYSKERLRTADSPRNIQPDRVEYRGESYQVESVEDWDELGGYFKPIALKEGQ